MDKRSLLTMLLVLLIFMVLQLYVFPPKKAPVQDAQSPADSVAADSLAKVVQSSPAASDSLIRAASASETIKLQNDRIQVSFETLGASISSVELNDFTWAKEQRKVNLIPENESVAGIRLLSGGGDKDLRMLNWFYEAQPDSHRVRFYLGDSVNPIVEKIYALDGGYGITLDVSVSSPHAVNGIEYDFSAGIADSEITKDRIKGTEYKVIVYAGNDDTKTSLAKVIKQPLKGPLNAFGWAALRTKYFTLAMVETGNQLIRNYEASVNTKTGNPGMILDSWDRVASQNWKQSFLIYAGPADYDTLKGYAGRHLELIPERGAGWYRWLSNIIAWFLKWLHKFIHNYGVVIIIFSVVLKIILHPLTQKSMDSNLKMQRIQPQIQELQKKYKNDPKTLQIELSKLYKEAGTNPMSGCLPLLFQMPIFFALYTVLRYTIDMRNASFLGWLNLSEPDPYWILPIIMAGFMIVQSLMTRPSQSAVDEMDENQKAMQQSSKMMTWLMPVLMFFIFKGLPSGLVLYYTVFNILSVAQQYYLKKRLKTKEIQ
ncbi:MAG: membrane protein insertase YidC [Candidatus Cloacimonadota bacterium]|nr:membrane protein insertase YidC [Candidatus Cloacimonadota bacterium]NMD13430.1 membrane protein insertase YidC [Candidatus Cloacimonadota bacterium]